MWMQSGHTQRMAARRYALARSTSTYLRLLPSTHYPAPSLADRPAPSHTRCGTQAWCGRVCPCCPRRSIPQRVPALLRGRAPPDSQLAALPASDAGGSTLPRPPVAASAPLAMFPLDPDALPVSGVLAVAVLARSTPRPRPGFASSGLMPRAASCLTTSISRSLRVGLLNAFPLSVCWLGASDGHSPSTSSPPFPIPPPVAPGPLRAFHLWWHPQRNPPPPFFSRLIRLPSSTTASPRPTLKTPAL